ncbi:hypothetical protein ACPWSR_07425 [Alloiococcus sp. CFN-8]|uniref:hypothetical protein n=1 Tax=Alloiococcus sp. CFN-8 TaxID=3416081 RepID=UPI003CF1B91E
MRKLKVLMCCSMVLATVLGIYGQGISSYISNNFISVSPVIILSISTLLSLALFIFTPILIRAAAKELSKKKQLDPYVTVNNIVGIPVSIFSIFVLIMWWG